MEHRDLVALTPHKKSLCGVQFFEGLSQRETILNTTAGKFRQGVNMKKKNYLAAINLAVAAKKFPAAAKKKNVVTPARRYYMNTRGEVVFC